MRIESVHIKNLRSIKDAVITLDDYVCFVGPNGAGKSTVLCALNIFFRESGGSVTDLMILQKEDFHKQDTSEPIQIIVTFTNLSRGAQEDFKNYYRQGKLIVEAKAEYNSQTETAEVKQYGYRLGMPDFMDFFKAYGDGEKVAALKEKYIALRELFSELPAASPKDAMAANLQEFEAAHPDRCALLPSSDLFYGFSRGENRLAKYIQWVYVPAVKDMAHERTEGKNSALGKLIARTVRTRVNFKELLDTLRDQAKEQYRNILGDHQAALDEISASLKTKLSQWAHPDATLRLVWQQDSDKSIQVIEPLARILAGEDNFEGDLSRLGHGFQRSYLLALLQELANAEGAQEAPKLILGCEEPELYQHPPQAKHLAGVLVELSANNAQIIVTTHCPHFISGKDFESVRLVKRDDLTKHTIINQLKYLRIAEMLAIAYGEVPKQPSAAMAKIQPILQPELNEMFFTQHLVLVEGQEDIAHIHAWMALSGRWEAFRRSGCHIVPVGGKSEMVRPLIIAHGLDIQVFVIFDADNNEIHAERRRLHERDNMALLRTVNCTNLVSFPDATIWEEKFVMWPTNLGEIVDKEIATFVGPEQWGQIRETAERELGHAGNLRKNGLYIGEKLSMAYEAGARPDSLERLCRTLLNFGRPDEIFTEAQASNAA